MIYTKEKYDTVSQVVNSYFETYNKPMSAFELVEHIAHAYCIDNLITGDRQKYIIDEAKKYAISFKCIRYDLKVSKIVYQKGMKYDAMIKDEYPILDKIANNA